ncbi:ABC transporter permease [Mesorhizobium qingshengii]|uniref:Mannopine transport system permease protein n=1 Tax=Mesorhizobium qingshengii TaxID=1165689 RepID=A0A1G5WJI8_9HYPH|nr:ABC transporter permease [Mesorhizobium qingshengii]SDA58130.1 mannopine transport system permease protein [Mesorhizobium qingshengii]
MADVASRPSDHSLGRPGGPASRYSRALSFSLIGPLLLLLLVGFLYPIAALIKLSLFTPALDFTAYRKIIEQPIYLSVMARTFRIALSVTIASFVLGYPVALAMASLKRRLAAVATAAVFIALWSPVLVRSYAWIVLLQRNGVVNNVLQQLGLIEAPLKLIYNEGAVILAMTHVLLPFMILPIFAALRSIPQEYVCAARSLGAGATMAFLRITLPLSLPGIFAGCVMCFILALGFYITPALVGGPGTLIVATLIGQQATVLLDWPFAAALSTILVIATLTMVLVFRKAFSMSKGFASVD